MSRQHRVVDCIFGVDGTNIEDLYDATHFGLLVSSQLDRVLPKERHRHTALMAAFAHAGDFAGAAAVRWGGCG